MCVCVCVCVCGNHFEQTGYRPGVATSPASPFLLAEQGEERNVFRLQFAPESIISRVRFGYPVPYQTPHQAESGAYVQHSTRLSHISIWPPSEPTGTGPEILKLA